jgi:hypothetical protein
MFPYSCNWCITDNYMTLLHLHENRTPNRARVDGGGRALQGPPIRTGTITCTKPSTIPCTICVQTRQGRRTITKSEGSGRIIIKFYNPLFVRKLQPLPPPFKSTDLSSDKECSAIKINVDISSLWQPMQRTY